MGRYYVNERVIFLIINLISLSCCVTAWSYTYDEVNITHEQSIILNPNNTIEKMPNITIKLGDFQYTKIISGNSLFKNLLIDITEYEYDNLIYNLIRKCFKRSDEITTFQLLKCIYYQSYFLVNEIKASSLIRLSNIRMSQLIYKIYDWNIKYLTVLNTYKYKDIFHQDIESCLLINKNHDVAFVDKYFHTTFRLNRVHPSLPTYLNYSCVEEQFSSMKKFLGYDNFVVPMLKKIIWNNFEIDKRIIFFHDPSMIKQTNIINLFKTNNTITILNFYYVTYFKKIYRQYTSILSTLSEEELIHNNKIISLVHPSPSVYTLDEKIKNINLGLHPDGDEYTIKKRNNDADDAMDVINRVSSIFSINIGNNNNLLRNKNPKCTTLIGDSSFTKEYSNLVIHREKMSKLYNKINSLTSFDFFSRSEISKFLVRTFRLKNLREYNIIKNFIAKPLKVLLDITQNPKFLLSEEIQHKYRGTFILNKDNTCLIRISKKSVFKEFLFLITSLFGGVKLVRSRNNLNKELNILIDDLFADMKRGTIDYFNIKKCVQKFHDSSIPNGGKLGRYLFKENALFRLFILVQEPHIFSIVMEHALEVIE